MYVSIEYLFILYVKVNICTVLVVDLCAYIMSQYDKPR